MNTPKIDDASAPSTMSSAVGWRQRSHGLVTPRPAPVSPSSEPVRRRVDAAGRAVVHSAVLLLTVLLLLLIQRLPWNGDLGLHAATIERLRADLLHPGSPQVDADTDSPYYSPWTVLLALVAKATGANAFTMLRIAALITLPLLLTGIRHFTRTLSKRRLAPPLAVLCLLLLWGPPLLAWSGFLELGSLALVISYPSTFVVALSFHFWALLTKALRTAASWKAYIGLGLMWAVIMLSHQFSGVVATLGALAVLLAARPWPAKETWLHLAWGFMLGVAVIAVWPYYSFFSLFGFDGLEEINLPLYRDMPARFGLAFLGVVALLFRWRRDKRDPLVILFSLGSLVVAAGGLTGHWSWGRALPAAIIPAQLAIALAIAEAGNRFVRNALAAVTAAALLFGAWTQSTALGYVMVGEALPQAVREKSWPSWQGPEWVTRAVKPGDTVMTTYRTGLMLPAYGIYTVAPGFDDIFLPDQKERHAAVERFFARDTSRRDQLDILHRYNAKWLLRWDPQGGLPSKDPALRRADFGPDGQTLYKVVG
ncbi:MAG TPA: hypothetical protein VFF37_13120 [Streptomyces sp.]|nr:hypothetical protein [Streptomyces sp.]